MAILLSIEADTVKDDYSVPQDVKLTEPDQITRKMIVKADSEATAMAMVALGAAHPDHGDLFCRTRTAKPRVCGHLYECEFGYAGLYGGTTKSTVMVQDNQEGWDTGTEITIVQAASEAAAKATLTLGGSVAGYDNMFRMSISAEPIVELKVYRLRAQLKGISNDKPIKWIARGYAEKQSQKLAVYPGQSTPVPVESNQALVGVTAFWVSATVPDCSVSGTNVTPDFSPGVPDNIWSAIVNPIHVYPFGWVIETREPDIIPGATVCLVKDQYVYYQHLKPGGGQ